MTPRLAVGGEVFYLAEQRRSGFGLAARHSGDKHVSTLQIANTGLISLSYLQKVSEKVGGRGGRRVEGGSAAPAGRAGGSPCCGSCCAVQLLGQARTVASVH